ncbi:ribonuclease P protein component [Hazenella sp. IB182353]|uniref:ribonuclease P protein component n=1 Tax=Polycladospora coralii TaxID=2771432 RepID=UPI0017478D5B|nr:ribonuclease P protein component [Polycladospora coralii]MBS7530478.1 ribonuclease P protein component [Polycladospora coralii]
MQKKYRLKRRSDFRKIFRAGNSVANRQFVLVTRRNEELEEVRVGISVSKKVGNAVVRNRIKRTIKEIVRNWIPYIKSQVDIVIVVRNPVATMDYHQIKSSLNHVFQRGKLFHTRPPKE